MDQYGVGSAIEAFTRTLQETSRGTGRTTRMVENLQTGDVVVLTNTMEAVRVKRLCLQKQIYITTVVVDELELERLYSHVHILRSANRVVFDHSLVEAYYYKVLKDAAEHINSLERYFTRSEVKEVITRE